MIMFLCMTYSNIKDFPMREFDDMKIAKVKNSNSVIKYYKNGGIAEGYVTSLFSAYFIQL